MKDIFHKGQRATIIAGSITVFFALAKAIIGVISGSVVLLADALHSAADAFSTFLAYLGLKIAQKKPTDKFPYGFYKAESIAAFLISFLILFAAFSIAKESFNKIFVIFGLNIPFFAMSIALLDAISMFVVGSFEIKVGKEINSQSLIADGKESRLHIFSSFIVLIGLISGFLKIPYLEGVAGILIALFIFRAGFETLRDSTFALMDVSPSREVEEKIKKVLKSISGIQGFENLKLRKSGPFVFGAAEIKIRKNVSIKRAHEISRGLEEEIKKAIPVIDSFLVKVLPYQTEKQKICIPIEKDEGLNSKISPYFGRAKNFLFLEIDNQQIKSYYRKSNPHKEAKARAGLRAAQFIIKEKIDAIITREMGPIALYTLRDNIVDIYKGEEESLKENVKKFLKGELKSLKAPTKKR
jgi:cation diffusion facilitator family transporter